MFDFGIKSRNLKVLFLSFFLAGTLFFLPIIALYFKESLFTLTNVAIIFSVLATSTMIFEVPSGVISDLFGRRNTMIASYLILLLSIFFLYFGSNMLMFCIFAVLKALSRSLSSGTDKALIYDTLKAEGQEHLFKKATGIYQAAWALGGSLGSLVGGFLAVYSLSLPVLASFVPVGLSIISILFLKEVPFVKADHKKMHKQTLDSIKTILRDKQLIIIALSGVFLMGIGASLHELRAIFFEYKEIPLAYFGIISAFAYGLASLGFASSHYIAEKLGDKLSLVSAVFLFAVIYISAVFSGPLIVGLCFIATSFFFGVRSPIMDHLVNREIESSQRATIMSINSLMNQVGLAIISIFFGYWADAHGIDSTYLLGGVALLVVPVLFLFLKKDPSERMKSSTN